MVGEEKVRKKEKKKHKPQGSNPPYITNSPYTYLVLNTEYGVLPNGRIMSPLNKGKKCLEKLYGARVVSRSKPWFQSTIFRSDDDASELLLSSPTNPAW